MVTKNISILILYDILLTILFVFLSDIYIGKMIPIDILTIIFLFIFQFVFIFKKKRKYITAYDFFAPILIMVLVWLSNGFLFLQDYEIMIASMPGLIIIYSFIRILTFFIVYRLNIISKNINLIVYFLTQYFIIFIPKAIIYVSDDYIFSRVIFVEIFCFVVTFCYVYLAMHYYSYSLKKVQ